MFYVILASLCLQEIIVHVACAKINKETEMRQITDSEEELLDQLVNVTVPKIKQDFRSGQSWMETIARTFGYRRHHYAVVIDCGSSGSRVHAYKFRIPLHLSLVFGGEPELEIISEYFNLTHPGLSSYADNPRKGAQEILQLVNQARRVIPRNKMYCTPLIIRATSGLRMLPKVKADYLLREVMNAVKNTGFNTSYGAEIMSGAEEGIYFWYSINWLMKRFDRDTMTALDLGGGSTQITLQLDAESTDGYPQEDIYEVNDIKNFTLYTHSYLNMGRFAARYGILFMESQDDSDEVLSSCMSPAAVKVKGEYKLPNVASRIKYFTGAPHPADWTSEQVLSRCADVIKSYVDKVGGARGAARGDVAGSSFLYDIAASVGIIDADPRRSQGMLELPNVSGAVARVGAFYSFATHACTTGNATSPWDCVDVLYIHTLLNYVYGMPDHQNIYLMKEIDGYDLSWCLGLAYATLMKKLRGMQAKMKNI